MRPIAPLGLLDSVQMRDYNLVCNALANGLCVVANRVFVHHVPMPEQSVTEQPPASLKIVVHNLASHRLSPISDLSHHTGR
jgi:hypothetical protein